MQVERLLAKKDTTAAVAELQKIITGYGPDTAGMAGASASAFRERMAQLTGRADNTLTVDSGAGGTSGAGAAPNRQH
jgi:hypothetical protein